MPFCSGCGTQLTSADGRYCPNCGLSVSASGQVTQLQQREAPVPSVQWHPAREAANVVGIYKELEEGEKTIFQSVTQTEVIFVKEAEIKKLIGRERKEIPISISKALVYLTNQRLLFLKLFELSATELGEEKNMLAGAGGTFYEVPLDAVTAVDMRQVKLNKGDEERFLNLFEGSDPNTAAAKLKSPALEIVYDEKAATGRGKTYIESMLRRGFLSKLWGKVEMTYDKILILGEQSVAIMPTLSERVRKKVETR